MSRLWSFKKSWPWITRKYALATDPESLREFVYLDEVSVTSLLSSKLGEIKAEVSDASSIAEDVQIAGSLTADAKILKSQLDSKFQTTSSQSTQTLRKSTIQSLFRDLKAATEDQHILRLRDFTDDDSKRKIADVLNDQTLCLREDMIARGKLAEITVELEAAAVFKVSTMLSEMYDLGQQHPEIFGNALIRPEIGAMTRIFDRMLTGLVPIVGKSEELVVFEQSGYSYLARRSTSMALNADFNTLSVVGIADKRFFWKDLRRILFSKSTFSMLVRIDRPGIHAEWTPVKLSDVFASVMPQMGDLSQLMDSMSESLLDSKPATVHAYDHALGNALHHFAAQAKGEEGTSEEETASLQLLIDDLSRRGKTDIPFQRAAFNAVASKLGVDISSQDGVRMRREARLASGLGLFDRQSSRSIQLDTDKPSQSKALLDTEIVAIYW